VSATATTNCEVTASAANGSIMAILQASCGILFPINAGVLSAVALPQCRTSVPQIASRRSHLADKNAAQRVARA
jgi:hypothetical protein